MKICFTLLLSLIAFASRAQFTFMATSNSPVCLGSTLQLSADGTSTDTYLWTGPNGFTSTLQNPVIPGATFADSGVYTLLVNGLNTYHTSSVQVYPSVTLSGVTTSATIESGSSIQLNATGAQYFFWSPENTSLSNPYISDPIASPTSTTTYKVVGMNQWGCTDSAFTTVTVTYPGQIFIPTAFTPNGDGLNDVFRVVNPSGFQLAEFKVFNKWGQVIYNNSGNIQQGWDGTLNGTPQDIDTYSYIITLVAPDSQKKLYKGTVALIR